MNIPVKHLPIIDGKIPTLTETQELISWLTPSLNQGKKIVIHCAGGLGRAGTIAACYLISQGHTATDAISIVRKARSPRAIETSTQENFIQNFHLQK